MSSIVHRQLNIFHTLCSPEKDVGRESSGQTPTRSPNRKSLHSGSGMEPQTLRYWGRRLHHWSTSWLTAKTKFFSQRREHARICHLIEYIGTKRWNDLEALISWRSVDHLTQSTILRCLHLLLGQLLRGEGVQRKCASHRLSASAIDFRTVFILLYLCQSLSSS